jgi:hypothetical protein
MFPGESFGEYIATKNLRPSGQVTVSRPCLSIGTSFLRRVRVLLSGLKFASRAQFGLSNFSS